MLRTHQSRFARNCDVTLRTCRRNDLCPQIYYARRAFSTKDSNVKSVAVLGAGISGLTAAFYLAQKAPGLPVTIYESSPRIGGWIRTTKLQTSKGRVEFESGPRTLRPFGDSFLVTTDIITKVGLGDKLLLVTNRAPAAMQRYIYYPDQIRLVPRSLFDIPVFDPLFEGLIWGFLGEAFRRGRPEGITDETVGSWISRRMHPKVSQNLISAMVHGIYAGDVDKLSMRSLFPELWRREGKYGSVVGSFFKSEFENRGMKRYPASDWRLRRELVPVNRWHLNHFQTEGTVMITFIGGTEIFTRAMREYLERAPNVRFRLNTTVKSLVRKGSSIQVHITNNMPPNEFSHVISTLPAPVTSSLLPAPTPSLSTVESVTVQVVNLFFENPSVVPVRGFGYLIPKSVPLEFNPEHGLGVIFDNETAVPPVFDAVYTREPPEAKGTKLTVMMGGHYWNGRTTYPTDEEAVQNARSLIKRHLGILDYPALTQVSTQVNAIPQYTVGHHDRMAFAHELMKMHFKGRVAVAGSSYYGVGINDCVRSAYEVVRDLLEVGKPGGLQEEDWTGLHKFVKEDDFVLIPRKDFAEHI